MTLLMVSTGGLLGVLPLRELHLAGCEGFGALVGVNYLEGPLKMQALGRTEGVWAGGRREQRAPEGALPA
jgi:hypothetical protein